VTAMVTEMGMLARPSQMGETMVTAMVTEMGMLSRPWQMGETMVTAMVTEMERVAGATWQILELHLLHFGSRLLRLLLVCEDACGAA
jgi:hypothetical protein